MSTRLAFDSMMGKPVNLMERYGGELIESIKSSPMVSTFVNTLTNAYNYYTSPEYNLNIRQAMNRVEKHLSQDGIYPIHTNSNLHMANEAMKSFIMCEPQVRKLYEENRISGFDDNFMDTYDIGDTPKDNHLYNLVHSGYDNINSDDEVFHYSSTEETYADITEVEKTYIIDTYETIRSRIYDGLDPTSIFEEGEDL